MNDKKLMHILLITGIDRLYHDYTIISPLYKTFLEEAGHTVTVTTDLNCFLPERIKDYDVIICTTIGRTLTKEQLAGLLAAVSGASREITGKPKGFVGLHSASASFMKSNAYLRMLGGKFLTHPPLGEFTLKIADNSHPITTNMTDFKFTDELYLMETYPPFNALITTTYDGFERPLAWVKPYGLGRVFYCALGHGPEQIAQPIFQKIVKQAVNWAAATA